MFRRDGKTRPRARLTLLPCAVALVVCGCMQKPRIERPTDFIPADADVIALLHYDRFVKNDVLRRTFDLSQLEPVLLKVGLSSENIGRVAGFARISMASLISADREARGGNLSDFGVIVEGKKPLHPVFKSLAASGWVREAYGGKRIWSAPGEPLTAASLRGNMLVAGTPAGVRSVIDVARGKTLAAMKPESGSNSGAIFRQMGARGDVNIVISFSQEMKMAVEELGKSAGVFGGMVGGNMIGGVLDVLGAGRGIGLSFAGTKDGISSTVVFVAGDATSAKLLAGLVSMAKIVVPRMGQFGAPPEAVEFVRRVKVRAENNLVFIDFTLPESIIEAKPR